jgi:hypothetical protein
MYCDQPTVTLINITVTLLFDDPPPGHQNVQSNVIDNRHSPQPHIAVDLIFPNNPIAEHLQLICAVHFFSFCFSLPCARNTYYYKSICQREGGKGEEKKKKKYIECP